MWSVTLNTVMENNSFLHLGSTAWQLPPISNRDGGKTGSVSSSIRYMNRCWDSVRALHYSGKAKTKRDEPEKIPAGLSNGHKYFKWQRTNPGYIGVPDRAIGSNGRE